MHQEINKSRHQKGLAYACVFRPVKSTMRMVFKQNSLLR